MTEPTPMPEWAIERAQAVIQAACEPPFPKPSDAFAAALVAVRRATALECARYHDAEYNRHRNAAQECDDAGNDEEADHHRNSVYTHHRAAAHCRALADKAPT